jgi:hypothetical protein
MHDTENIIAATVALHFFPAGSHSAKYGDPLPSQYGFTEVTMKRRR